MVVRFKSNKLKKQCEDPRIAMRDFGKDIGYRLTQRINELRQAKDLSEIAKIPAARLHPLAGSRLNEYSVDLVHPFRLVFIPITDEAPAFDLADLSTIHIIRIEEVIDYHGKQKRK
jgi:proteic killer suppression protein